MILDYVGQQSSLVTLGNPWATATGERVGRQEHMQEGIDHLPKPERRSHVLLRSTLIGFNEFWHFQQVLMCSLSVLDRKAISYVSYLLKSPLGR